MFGLLSGGVRGRINNASEKAKSFLIKAPSEMEFKFLINDLPLESCFEMFSTTNQPHVSEREEWMNFMLVASSSRDTFSSDRIQRVELGMKGGR